LVGGKKEEKIKRGVDGWMGGWVGGLQNTLFCCMIARMPLGVAISPKKELRTHTQTPPVGLSHPIQHIFHCCKINDSNPVSSWMINTHEKQFPHP